MGAYDTKTGVDRTLPLPPIDWFKDRENKPLDTLVFPKYNKDRFEKIWRKMLKETEVNKGGLNYCIYSARHTKITNLIRKGHHISKVQKWAGHSRLETTAGYTHLADKDMLEMA